MPPDPITQERIYRALKDDFLAGAFVPGARIEIAAMADRHRVSTTPVREAIHRLVGEELLESHHDGGFQLVIPDADHLAHLYSWYGQMLLAALHLTPGATVRQLLSQFRSRDHGHTPLEIATAVASLFQVLGRASGNTECAAQLSRGNERLHYMRLAETRLFADVAREVEILARNGSIDVKSTLRRRLISYHRRRIERAQEIVNLAVSSF